MSNNDFMGKLSRIGNDLAAGLQDTGRAMKSDFEKARVYVADQQQQTEAQRQAAERYRWERAASPTWVDPAAAADTTGWAAYELVDPRSRKVAVSFRHPADWQAGGQVIWAPGAPALYAVGTSPADQSCVAERFPRLDLVADAGWSQTPGRRPAPNVALPELVASTIVPAFRPGALVVSVTDVDPRLYVSQQVEPSLTCQGALVALEYDRRGVPWADELVVLRYRLPLETTSHLVDPVNFGVAVWSLNARRDLFASVRATLRAVALSASSNADWDTYAAVQTGWPILP